MHVFDVLNATSGDGTRTEAITESTGIAAWSNTGTIYQYIRNFNLQNATTSGGNTFNIVFDNADKYIIKLPSTTGNITGSYTIGDSNYMIIPYKLYGIK